MTNSSTSIQDRTKKFAVRVINALKIPSNLRCRRCRRDNANCSEAEFAQSNKDFLSKYSIALKEASETKYWIEIMIDSKIVPSTKFQPMLEELSLIIKILISTTKKLKEKEN